VRHKRGGEVRFFTLRSSHQPSATGPTEMPHRSRFDCLDASPLVGRPPEISSARR
jgi:hypothetical protein